MIMCGIVYEKKGDVEENDADGDFTVSDDKNNDNHDGDVDHDGNDSNHQNGTSKVMAR